MLGSNFRELYEHLKGKTTSRAETCYLYTNKILANLLGALFIRERFTPKIKSDVSISSKSTFTAYNSTKNLMIDAFSPACFASLAVLEPLFFYTLAQQYFCKNRV